MQKNRLILPFLVTLLLVLLAVWSIAGEYLFYQRPWIAWLLIGTAAVALFLLLLSFSSRPQKLIDSNFRVDFNNTKALDRLANANPTNVQEIAASQIELLSNYHNLVLEQARRSFAWAIIAAAIGLIFFIAAVSFIIYRDLQSAAIISVISGALVEVISGINFYLYGQTSKQMNDFQNRLDTTQRFLLANSICESLEGDYKEKSRSELITIIATQSLQFPVNQSKTSA